MKQWFGSSDHRTSPSHFCGSHEYHYVDFHRVKKMIIRLAKWRITELIYINDESLTNFVVAYRFTSDRFYDRFWHKLMRAGGSGLGRGVWNPFGDHYQYFEYFGCPCCGQNPAHDYNVLVDFNFKTCPTQQERIKQNNQRRAS